MARSEYRVEVIGDALRWERGDTKGAVRMPTPMARDVAAALNRPIGCTCTCCLDAVERHKTGRNPIGGCQCAGACDCPFCLVVNEQGIAAKLAKALRLHANRSIDPTWLRRLRDEVLAEYEGSKPAEEPVGGVERA